MELRERIEVRTDVWRKRADQLARGAYGHGHLMGKIDAAELILGWLDEADAPPEELPEGVRTGFVLEPGAIGVKGWRYFHPAEREWFPMGGVYPVANDMPIIVEPIPVPPEPEMERVRLDQLKGRSLTKDVGKVVKIEQTREGAWHAFCAWGAWPAVVVPDADGMVSVLKETGR